MGQTDAQLLRATARGDADAFATFFRRHEIAVTRFVARRCSSAHDVPDIVADVFMAAMNGAARYVEQTADARPWLLGIATRQVSSRTRRLARQGRAFARHVARSAERTAAESELIEAALDAGARYDGLRSALAAIPKGQRDVLCLVALADLSPTEAAIALKISPNAARVRLARARQRLQTEALTRGNPPCSGDPEVSNA